METTKEQLLSMMQRYEIGKKPLARLLGWGETTVMRYLDGVEPNGEFLRRIRELSANPWEYADLLEKNGDVLTQTAYKKTKRAVFREIFCDRSTEAMQYVISLADGDIAPYRVVSVLYYAQICSLVLRGLPLFEEKAEFAVRETVVYPRLYRQMKVYGIRNLHPEISALSVEEQDYLKTVWQVLNGYSPNALRTLFLRDKKRLRRHLKNGADRMDAELLRGQYELMLKKAGVETPIQMKQFFSTALKEQTKEEKLSAQ